MTGAARDQRVVICVSNPVVGGGGESLSVGCDVRAKEGRGCMCLVCIVVTAYREEVMMESVAVL